jgi:hypothetical protein
MTKEKEELKVPLIVSVSGIPKTGKTHLSFTFPSPIAYFEFDIKGADPIIGKFPGKKIDVYKFPLPIIDSDPPAPYAGDLMTKFDAQYQKAVASGEYKTVIIDTASMVWRVIGHAEAEAVHQKKILQVQYYRPNLRMNSLFTRCKMAGVNMVAICYLADVYLNNERTGDVKTDGWGQTEAAVDVVLWTARSMKPTGKGKQEVVFETTIKSNRYEPKADGMVLPNTSYEEIYTMLGLP